MSPLLDSFIVLALLGPEVGTTINSKKFKCSNVQR